MNKKVKITLIVSMSLLVWWALLFFTNTKEHMSNYWWQVGMGAAAILFGIFGLHTAKKWNWLKSGVGKGTFFISLGLIFWGIGQSCWTYYLIRYPGQEVPTAMIIDIAYFSSIPMWTYGILKLSKATGAKYGLRETRGRIFAVVISTVMIAASYYFLVVVARGGTAYFSQSFHKMFFDLGYAIGDAINFTLTLVIVILSWNLLGGKFRRSILLILASFGLVYLADFMFSYYDGKGWYYNGDVIDLLFLLMLTTFALGLSMLDPSRKSTKKLETKPMQPLANESITQETALAAQEHQVETPIVEPIAQTVQSQPYEENTVTSEENQQETINQPTPQEASNTNQAAPNSEVL